MKPILDWFTESYFTLPILMICQFGAALVGYRHRHKFAELKYFHLYPIASLTQGIFACATVGLLDPNTAWKYSRISIMIFIFLEAILLYNFFSNAIKVNSLKFILKALFIGFFIFSIAIFVLTNTFLNSEMIITGETCVVILSVCLYFKQLFRMPASHEIIEEPAFWINIGVLFVFSCTLPAMTLSFFGQGSILSDSYAFIINFVGYSVLFLFIIRGYLCRKEEVISVRRNFGFNSRMNSREEAEWQYLEKEL